MASSTRGGKRGKKSKALKMYKTPGGAMQYGTPDAFRRAAKNAGKSDPENFDKYDTAIVVPNFHMEVRGVMELDNISPSKTRS